MMTRLTRTPANVFSVLRLKTTLGVKYGIIMGTLRSKAHHMNESASKRSSFSYIP